MWKLSQDLLVVTDFERNNCQCQSGLVRTLGWFPDDLIDANIDRLVHADDRERSNAELANLVAGRKTRHLENRIPVRTAPIAGCRGSPCRTAGSFTRPPEMSPISSRPRSNSMRCGANSPMLRGRPPWAPWRLR